MTNLEKIRAYIAADSRPYADLTVRRVIAAVERLHILRILDGWCQAQVARVARNHFRKLSNRVSAQASRSTVYYRVVGDVVVEIRHGVLPSRRSFAIQP